MNTYRLYVGQNNETGHLDTIQLVNCLSTRHKGFTIEEAQGYWEGKPEHSAIITIATEEDINATVEALKIELKQDAIGLQQVEAISFV